MSWTAWRVQAGAKLTQPNELQSTRVVCFMAGEPGPPTKRTPQKSGFNKALLLWETNG